jgi:hypothetical protein
MTNIYELPSVRASFYYRSHGLNANAAMPQDYVHGFNGCFHGLHGSYSSGRRAQPVIALRCRRWSEKYGGGHNYFC